MSALTSFVRWLQAGLRLRRRRGELPQGFVARRYRALHADLRDLSDEGATAHYRAHGRAEGRRYRPDVTALAAAFARLAGIPEDESIPGFDAFLARFGLERGLWLERVDPRAFVEANHSWLASPPTSVAEAVLTFTQQGVGRLAPLSLDDVFDPDFYCSLTGAKASTPVELYRMWLNTGLERGEAPNERRFIEAKVGISAFPAAFDESRYRAALPLGEQPEPGRAQALAHLVEVGLMRGIRDGVEGQGASELFEAIGRFQVGRGRYQAALVALEAAGRLTADGHHARGDALWGLNRASDAVDAYDAAADAPNASVRTHVRAAEALVEIGDLAALRTRLTRSAALLSGSLDWRTAILELMSSALERDLAAAVEPDSIEKAARRFIELMDVGDPPPPRLPAPPEGFVALLAETEGDTHVEQRRRQVTAAGWYADLHHASQITPFLTAIHWARAVLVSAAGPAVVHALSRSRALGVLLIFDPSPGDVEVLSRTGGNDAYRAALLRIVASLCDFGLASTEAAARITGPLTRSGRCHVVPRAIDPTKLTFLERPWTPLTFDCPTLFFRSSHGRFDKAEQALARALARHPELWALIEGDEPGEELAPFANRVVVLDGPAGGDANWEVLSGVDLCLDAAPLDSATPALWLDAATCSVPSVVSVMPLAREGVRPIDGIVIADSSERIDAELDRLLTDSVLRRELGAKARAAALAHYHPDRVSEALRTIIQNIGSPAETQPRVLLVDGASVAPWSSTLALAEVVQSELQARFTVDILLCDASAEAGTLSTTEHNGMIVLRVGIGGAVLGNLPDPALDVLLGLVLNRLRPAIIDVVRVEESMLRLIDRACDAGIPFLVPDQNNSWEKHQDGEEGTAISPKWCAADLVARRRLSGRLNLAQPRSTGSRIALYQAILAAVGDRRATVDAANRARDSGEYARAETDYRRVLAVDPHYHFAHYESAVLRMLQRDHAGGLAAVCRLLAFSPEDERARRLAALLLHRLGGHTTAIALLQGLEGEETERLREFGDLLERFPFEWALAQCEEHWGKSNYVDADRLLQLTRAALRRDAGFAMIRLGDGEGAFLVTDPEDERRLSNLHRANRADRAKVWFGEGADIERTGFLMQARRIGDLVGRMDVVGIPYPDRVRLEYGHLSPSGVTAMVEILRTVQRDLGPHGHVCSHDIHFDLHGAGLLDLIAEQTRIGVVACHAGLPELLQRRFGCEVEFLKIPGEKLMVDEIGAEATEGEHFPEIFHSVMKRLDRPLAGRLFLVSGGLLGKFYCDRIRTSGGVALDIGSLVDLWLGYRTRPGFLPGQLSL